MLTRCYEATSYLRFINSNEDIQRLREKMYYSLKNGCDLEQSKSIFRDFAKIYEESTQSSTAYFV